MDDAGTLAVDVDAELAEVFSSGVAVFLPEALVLGLVVFGLVEAFVEVDFFEVTVFLVEALAGVFAVDVFALLVAFLGVSVLDGVDFLVEGFFWGADEALFFTDAFAGAFVLVEEDFGEVDFFAVVVFLVVVEALAGEDFLVGVLGAVVVVFFAVEVLGVDVLLVAGALLEVVAFLVATEALGDVFFGVAVLVDDVLLVPPFFWVTEVVFLAPACFGDDVLVVLAEADFFTGLFFLVGVGDLELWFEALDRDPVPELERFTGLIGACPYENKAESGVVYRAVGFFNVNQS